MAEIPTKIVLPNAKHEALWQDLTAMLRRHEELPAVEMLAVTASFLGSLLAFQDQRKYTADMLLKLISENIEEGNQRAVASVVGKTQGNG